MVTMDSHSPSPSPSIPGQSATISPYGSLRLSSSSNSHELPGSTNRTGLVSSLGAGGRRSYGTVSQQSSSFKRSSISVLSHQLEDGDTLQGLALKYNVTVQEIQKLNNVWSTDSMFSKSSLKIPIGGNSSLQHSNQSNSPSHSPGTRRRYASSCSSESHASLSNGIPDCEVAARMSSVAEDEEVRSKPRGQRLRSETVTAECGANGVKSIWDILTCADMQLQASRDFAEKLAKRSASLTVAKDAYHRTHRDTNTTAPPLPNSSPVPVPATQNHNSPKSKRRLHLKQVKQVDLTPERMQESKEKLEENMFEL